MDPSSFVDSGAVALAGMKRDLASLDPTTDSAAAIDRIRLLDELEATIAAVRAVQATTFRAGQEAEQIAAGVPAERVGRGIAAQIGLARRMSPHAAAEPVKLSV